LTFIVRLYVKPSAGSSEREIMTRKIEIKCPIKCALPQDYKLLTQELEVFYYLNEDPAITYL
jgi:hypothetical protein